MSPRLSIIAGVIALAAAIAGWVAYSSSQKAQQQAAIRQLVADSTTLLREALTKSPTAGAAAKLDANLQAIKAPSERAFADAAEHYILGAREIVRRRLDADRMIAETAAGRQGLAAHMARPSVPRERWIHSAGEMKRRIESQHADLGRVLKAIEDLLFSMPEAAKNLAPFVSADLLIEEPAVNAARRRARAEAARAAEDLQKARDLAPR